MKSFIWSSIATVIWLLFTLSSAEIKAQISKLSVSEAEQFSRHLVEENLHEENLALHQKLPPHFDTLFSLAKLRSFSYLKLGYTDSAQAILIPFRSDESQLFQLYIEVFSNSKTDTNFYECAPDLYPYCFDVLKAGLLKSRRFDKYGELFYTKNKGELNFDSQFEEYVSVKKRRPIIAAGMSAIIPGTGKMYAGKTGEGIGALITNLILGWQFYDHYNYLGIRSFRTITYGTLFSAFYLGNIYGSAISVRVLKNQQYEVLDNSIMLDISVPMERLFKR